MLELKKVNETDDEIVFCDAWLKVDLHGVLSWQLYDKTEDMGSMASKLNRYNHAHTTLANLYTKQLFETNSTASTPCLKHYHITYIAQAW